ncbi:unnamed protein product, partial [Rotaria magnacalcarata]
MCTYQHAFDGKGLMNVIYKVVEGKPPELPKSYSKELNDLLKKMLMKDPKNRPSAAQLLQTPFIVRHRERTNLNGPLENTISGNLRSRDINTHLQGSIIYGEMQKQNWSLASKDHVPDDYIQSGNISLNNNDEVQQDDDKEKTLKSANTLKTAKQTTVVRKFRDGDAHDQQFNQALRSNPMDTTQNRQMVRENTNLGTMKQSQSFTDNAEENPPIVNNRGRNPAQVPNENKFNNRNGTRATSFTVNMDSRPITPMRESYQQVVERFRDEDDSGYPNNQLNDRSPTRERDANERSVKNRRTMSGTQHSTINSMSRTMGPRNSAHGDQEVQSKPMSRTIGSATRKKTLLNSSVDD